MRGRTRPGPQPPRRAGPARRPLRKLSVARASRRRGEMGRRGGGAGARVKKDQKTERRKKEGGEEEVWKQKKEEGGGRRGGVKPRMPGGCTAREARGLGGPDPHDDAPL